MTIQRSVQDIVGFGIITKEPKTEKSKRTISMPDKLIEYYTNTRLGDKIKRSILGIDLATQIDCSAQKTAKISAQDCYEYDYKNL